MAWVRYLAVLPFVGLLGGVFFFNRVTPLVFGMPLLLAWIVLWILLTAVIMTVIYRCDPENADPAPDLGARRTRP
ncbi:MAG: DUF3311 domain-containing protein [Rhodospirillales bacterium]|nr:DUF3311 domain-containing protein [Rhodospirillales bacterium]MBN8896574.1 DUF3311 domain-containing protein [Rhodospirillales bacterium]